MRLEICAPNYQSAVNAQQAGAHRIELCEQLNVGGVTPSLSLTQDVLDTVTLPVFVLVRPRAGDFVYSRSEFDQMKLNILQLKNRGVSGIVSGVLNADKTIDLNRTQELIQLSKPLPFTFHRAFDEVPDPVKALEQLIGLGVGRILTSGQQDKAIDGLDLLKDLKRIANSRIVIMPGSGVTLDNIEVFKEAHFSEIHSSATNGGKISNLETIKALLNVID